MRVKISDIDNAGDFDDLYYMVQDLIKERDELLEAAKKLIKTANPKGEPWRCPDFAALAKLVEE